MRCDVLGFDDTRWRELLRATRHDVYHLPEYVAIEARRTRYRGGALLIGDGERQLLLPYLVRRGPIDKSSEGADVADLLSPYGYAGVLVSAAAAGDRGFLGAALRQLQDHLAGEGICAAFLRQHPVLSPELEGLGLAGLSLRRVPTMIVRLDRTEPEIWAHTRKGHQSTINRCMRLGQTARIGSWREDGEAFREIYRETMAQAGASGDYYFDDAYFDALQALGDRVHLCLVDSGGELAAACLLFERCGIVHAHLGGTRERHRPQSPFSLLLHFARLWARERGNEVLHLGSGVGGSEDAVFHFKAGFSRDRTQYVDAQFVVDEVRYKKLVEVRAASLGVAPDALVATGFFPAYRAMPKSLS